MRYSGLNFGGYVDQQLPDKGHKPGFDSELPVTAFHLNKLKRSTRREETTLIDFLAEPTTTSTKQQCIK